MPLDPSIISNAFANISMPDANALMQQRAQGAQNIYQLERQRQADAAAEQEAMQAETLQALSPAVAAAFEDPSDAGLDAAFSLVPEEFGEAADAQLAQLRSIPDVNRRKAVIRSALLQDDYGRALLAQLEPSANMRLQEGTAARRAALDERRMTLEEAKLKAGEDGGGKVAFRETDAEGNVRLYDAQGTEIGMLPKAGKPVAPAAGGAGASESERIAAYNTDRALNAAKRIANAIKDDPEATAPGMGEAFTNLFVDPNLIRSEERQRVSAAQREMIDALLTLATGAAYNKEQLEGQMESYIPRWTDKEGNRADKRAALLDLIESAKVKSGRAWTPEMDAAFSSLLEGAETAPGGDDTVDDNNPLLGGGL
jgi:hypothetical protein